MQVRFVYERYLVSESTEALKSRVQLLWSRGKSSIEEAIAQYVQQELPGSGVSDRFYGDKIQIVLGGRSGWCERFLFVGGRESIINCLHFENDRFSIEGRNVGTALGVVTHRKKELFGKNKTLVAVCPIPSYTPVHKSTPAPSTITPVTAFIGDGTPLDSTGRRVTFPQLAGIVQSIFHGG